MKTLTGLGWQWRTDGVLIRLCLDGQCTDVLVPLASVYHCFAKSLADAGAPMPPVVGGNVTISGLFSGIAHAVSSVAHGITHNAITKAAGSVVSTAVRTVEHNPITNAAGSVLSHIPVAGTLVKSVANLVATPLNVADQLAKGGRIDKVAMGNLKNALASVKQVAPYAQLVLAAVPGVGTGLSGAIGAGLALASGQNISDALIAGVRGALPGGPLAAAAFDVAHAAMQGKPITQIALNALPISPAQKSALVQGVQLARDLANGKNVAQSAVDAATHALPADLQKAVQIGAALAHAKSLQSAVGTLASAAVLTNQVQNGVAAAQQIKALGSRAVPRSLVAAVQTGLKAHAAVTNAVQLAAKGHPGANLLVGALQLHAASQPSMKSFHPRYHSKSGTVGAPFGGKHGGIHHRFHGGNPGGKSHAPFQARYHTHPRAQVQNSHVGAPWARHRFFNMPHMPYVQPLRLHAAYGR
jgi:hypothetical protein